MDCYRDMEDVEQTFLEFMDRVPFYGMVVACNDDDDPAPSAARCERRIVTYGTREDSDFRISNLQCEASKCGAPLSRFRVSYRGKDLGEFQLHVPGEHNVLNATAAIAVGIGLDIPSEHIRQALSDFRGVDRRFQLKGSAEALR